MTSSIIKKAYQPHIFLDENRIGRDFVVSDLHGYRDQLDKALLEVSFNPNKDRLISVGDLIDRGPNSQACLDLLEEPWFWSVMGNHEQLLIDAVEHQTDALWSRWLLNGGSWILKCDDAVVANYASSLKFLPLTITIPVGGQLMGVCHAQYSESSWLERKTASEHSQADWLWGRSRLKNNDTQPINDIDWVFNGHTVVPDITTLGNSVFIERGTYLEHPISLINLHQWASDYS
ncbi:metallophosphoesterase [Reinekea marina]|uniref:Metallophosphoesterase n=1 Tax=Reinekea marina TaxID=1310421 RepID=A0ABV7WN75_9GAMM|nr:metallophosphoesterase [Reinekea marina]MBU2863281.1 metallophosphoesterase [Reinekea forsetii]MDN3649495.1 metallophosphoesterase [Reinekea marina]